MKFSGILLSFQGIFINPPLLLINERSDFGLLAPFSSETGAFHLVGLIIVLASVVCLGITQDFTLFCADCNLPFDIIADFLSGAFFAASIARLSISLTNSFQAPPRVFSSAISAINLPAVARYVQESGFLIISPIVSSIPSCSTSVCGDLRPSTIADCVMSQASFLSVAYWFFNSAYLDHLRFCTTAVSILSDNSCTDFTRAE